MSAARENGFIDSIALQRGKVNTLDVYPFSMPAIRALDGLDLHPKVTFFVGENGSGKSTLLEAIAVAMGFNAEGGSRNFNFETRPTESSLHEYLTVSRRHRPRTGFFMRAESFYNVASEIDNLGEDLLKVYGGRSLHEQSHGESFLALAMNRFGPNGLYLLDEPESALSFSGSLALLRRMHDLSADNCQFIVATHSPVLMAYPDAWIYEFSEQGIKRREYEDTEQFFMMQAFYSDRDRFFRRLFEDDLLD